MNKVFKVGLIGCGHIAETYFRGHQYFNNFKIVACADINQKASEKCAKLYNIKSMTVNEILKDKDIEVILNLTIPQSHYSVSKKTFKVIVKNMDEDSGKADLGRKYGVLITKDKFISDYLS